MGAGARGTARTGDYKLQKDIAVCHPATAAAGDSHLTPGVVITYHLSRPSQISDPRREVLAWDLGPEIRHAACSSLRSRICVLIGPISPIADTPIQCIA
jgi:hypothetical protein